MSATSETCPLVCGEDRPVEQRYCAEVSGFCGEDPIGSAPGHRRYLLVEVPLPWEHQVEQSKHFPEGLGETLKRVQAEVPPFRLLGFAPEPLHSVAGHRRIICYERPDGPFARFDKREFIVPEQRLNALVEALLHAEGDLSSFEDCLTADGETRDLFVCTHGSHDVCCGKFGYPAYKEIFDRYALSSGGRLRVWRTSHFGGHRHAPTMIDFPEGRYWAQITSERLDALLLRQGGFEPLARHYRGWGGVGTFEQVVEREMLLREGWDWIEYKKQAELHKKDEASAVVRLHVWRSEDAECETYEAEVSISGKVGTGGCGHGWGEARQFTVSDVTQV
ncbi:hypothetical protein PAESOLCIP111_02597 [Paenibacillus solanacearum]|uniref:Sucrase ferredoxin n=1 Tax=Paenibacillus solanacearum TaxID=2048548 RepID=A0A916K2F8_9BACL|nr:sucrase ferredoxin [Paenibacillus solanacearum]CAG7624071.1 hypothetical protein PAESOLCIP111_02597 [Paenibacillus solanacearum]